MGHAGGNLGNVENDDAAGRRTRVADSQGGVTTSTYDDAGQLASRAWNGTGASTGQGMVTYAYDPRGRVTSQSRFSDAAGTTRIGDTANGYDDLGRLVERSHHNSAGTTLTYATYTYDHGDRLTGKTEDGTPTAYQYDATDQLTKDGANATITYDGTGNRTNAGYSTTTGNRMTSDGLWTWTYDDAGQVTGRSQSGESWAYEYDHRGQMTVAVRTVGGVEAARVTYSYDAFGNRIARADGTGTEWYAVDGWDPQKGGGKGTEAFDVWADLRAGDGLLLARRVYDAGWDTPLARQVTGGAVSWYVTDHQGSVRRVLDNSGAVSGTLGYDAFGKATSATGLIDRYRFTAREWDAVLQLQYSRARIYDADTGRWLSPDPLGFAAGDVNLFRMMGNRATTGTDPSGLWEKDKFWKEVEQRAKVDPRNQFLLDVMRRQQVEVNGVWIETKTWHYINKGDSSSGKPILQIYNWFNSEDEAANHFYDAARRVYRYELERELDYIAENWKTLPPAEASRWMTEAQAKERASKISDRLEAEAKASEAYHAAVMQKVEEEKRLRKERGENMDVILLPSAFLGKLFVEQQRGDRLHAQAKAIAAAEGRPDPTPPPDVLVDVLIKPGAEGLVTGAKADVNGLSQAGLDIVTVGNAGEIRKDMGLSEKWRPWPLDQNDTDNIMYDTAEVSGRIGGHAGFAAATLGTSGLSQSLVVGESALAVGFGYHDMLKHGVTPHNSLMVVGGSGVALLHVPNAKGGLRARSADAVAEGRATAGPNYQKTYPGDLVLGEAGDEFIIQSELLVNRYPLRVGGSKTQQWYNAIIHGESEGKRFVYTIGRERFEETATQMIKRIQNDPTWQGRPIRLISCNAGKGGHDSLAAAIRDGLDVPVLAPPTLIYTSRGAGSKISAWSTESNGFIDVESGADGFVIADKYMVDRVHLGLAPGGIPEKFPFPHAEAAQQKWTYFPPRTIKQSGQ